MPGALSPQPRSEIKARRALGERGRIKLFFFFFFLPSKNHASEIHSLDLDGQLLPS